MTLATRIEEIAPGVVVSASAPDRIAYARDLWPRHHLAVSAGRIAEHRPDLVVWPRTAQEVAAIVKLCATEGIPLVPFGAGSGVCGGVLPDNRTVVLDLKKMAAIRSISRDTQVLDVGAGALGIRLEEDLQAAGFTLGHFPSSILCSTVGGWVAARSAGQCSGLYGKIEDMVVSLECVVGDGEIVRFRRRTNGPDMTPLIIGSEGVLGVVTSAELRLHKAPQSRSFGAFSFPNVEAGWEFLRSVFQSGLRPAVARLYDVFDSFIARLGSVRRGKNKPKEKEIDESAGQGAGFGASVLRKVLRRPGVVNKLIDAAPSTLMGGATLIILFEGSSDQTQADMARAKNMALGQGAKDLGENPARHWLEHRYSVSYRQSPVFMAGAFSDTMEVAAPWSKLADLYRSVREALGKHVFVMAHLSHAYPDGCSIYFTFAGSAPTPSAMESIYDATWKSAMDAAISAGGTLSHHHGVGRSKAPKLGAELGLGVPIIHALRREIDPRAIMNPGNLLPRDAPHIRPVTPAPASPSFDAASLLLHASGKSTLAEVDAVLARHGLSLGLESNIDKTQNVATWLAEGAPGSNDPWLDPADHLLAGFTARLPSGKELEVRPSPRRAVGPDLFALFFGMKGQVGEIQSAWLRVYNPLRKARPLQTSLERNPVMDSNEQAWIERIANSVRSV